MQYTNDWIWTADVWCWKWRSTNCATTTAAVQLCWSIRMTSASSSASHHLKQFHLESIKVVPVPGTNVVWNKKERNEKRFFSFSSQTRYNSLIEVVVVVALSGKVRRNQNCKTAFWWNCMSSYFGRFMLCDTLFTVFTLHITLKWTLAQNLSNLFYIFSNINTTCTTRWTSTYGALEFELTTSWKRVSSYNHFLDQGYHPTLFVQFTCLTTVHCIANYQNTYKV